MLTFDEILKCTKGHLVQGVAPKRISSVSIDSRCMRCDALYIAIKGDHHDGHKFCKDIKEARGAAVLVSRKVKNCSLPMILVNDTTQALGDIAHAYRKKFSIPVVAITGSAGKTTTKDLIAKVLRRKYNVLKTHKNLNNQYGVPLTLLQLKPHHEIAVLELGINASGEMRYLAGMVEPTMAVFTNIGPSHLQGLKSLEGVTREKSQLMKFLRKDGVVVFNADDEYLRTSTRGYKRIGFSIKKTSRFHAKQIQHKGSRQIFQVNSKSFNINGLGKHHIYNALTAILCGRTFKLSYNSINTSLKSFSSERNRGSWEKVGSIWLLNDTYNANPLSFSAALGTLIQRRGQGKRIVVCADMLELGLREKYYHQKLAQELNAASIDVVLTFGKRARSISQRIRSDLLSFHAQTRTQLHQKLKLYLKPGDLLLIKGSRSMKMEETVNFLRKKYN